MKEREIQNRVIFDPTPQYLHELSKTISERKEKLPLVATELKFITDNNEELSRVVKTNSEKLFASGKRINEYIESVAFMHRILREHTIDGYPIISPATLSRIRYRDLSIFNYENKFPNLMSWIKQESEITDHQDQARHGFMSTFALAYLEIYPRTSFFDRFRK